MDGEHYEYEHDPEQEDENGIELGQGEDDETQEQEHTEDGLESVPYPAAVHTSEPDHIKPKRSHVQAACTFCKGRKMRCDGQKPSCVNCFNRKQQCEYPAFVKHRGPNKAKAAAAAHDDAAAQVAAAAVAAAAAAGMHAHITPYSVNGVIMYHPGIPGPSAYVPPGGMLPLPYPVSPTGRLKRSAEEYEADDGENDEQDGFTVQEYQPDDDSGMGGKKGRGGMRGGKRATMACHSCRQRKMKCDEVQPACSQCSRRNITCLYDEFVRRRGPSKKKRIEGTEVHLVANPSPASPNPHVMHHHAPPHLSLVPMPYSFPGAPPDAPKYMALMDPNGVPVQILGIEHPGMHGHIVPVMHHDGEVEEHDGDDEGDQEQGSPQVHASGDEIEEDDSVAQAAQHPQVVWS
ncbi:hypothetical protein BKA62DRAFT_668209 [Auriculariales sp. MPI-PUGE-AT-0066]|nr:hypothetical protein BKA62DRAFT_668209 [Auriculariales sp. MPI-PUGE-AT-0066]